MNKTAFLIGNGPSLNDIDMSLLKNQDTMSFNRAYIAYEDWGFDPTYFCAVDGNTMQTINEDVHKLVETSSIKKFFLLSDNGHVHNCEHLVLPVAENVFHIRWTSFPSVATALPNVVEDGNDLYFAVLANAGVVGLTILKHLGYEEVAFVGQDARYVDDAQYRDVDVIGGEYRSHEDNDVNHFRSDYFGKECIFGKPNQDQIISIWSGIKDWIDAQENFNVYSCTPNSNLNPYYKYIELEQFLKGER